MHVPLVAALPEEYLRGGQPIDWGKHFSCKLSNFRESDLRSLEAIFLYVLHRRYIGLQTI